MAVDIGFFDGFSEKERTPFYIGASTGSQNTILVNMNLKTFHYAR